MPDFICFNIFNICHIQKESSCWHNFVSGKT